MKKILILLILFSFSLTPVSAFDLEEFENILNEGAQEEYNAPILPQSVYSVDSILDVDVIPPKGDIINFAFIEDLPIIVNNVFNINAAIDEKFNNIYTENLTAMLDSYLTLPADWVAQPDFSYFNYWIDLGETYTTRTLACPTSQGSVKVRNNQGDEKTYSCASSTYNLGFNDLVLLEEDFNFNYIQYNLNGRAVGMYVSKAVINEPSVPVYDEWKKSGFYNNNKLQVYEVNSPISPYSFPTSLYKSFDNGNGYLPANDINISVLTRNSEVTYRSPADYSFNVYTTPFYLGSVATNTGGYLSYWGLNVHTNELVNGSIELWGGFTPIDLEGVAIYRMSVTLDRSRYGNSNDIYNVYFIPSSYVFAGLTDVQWGLIPYPDDLPAYPEPPIPPDVPDSGDGTTPPVPDEGLTEEDKGFFGGLIDSILEGLNGLLSGIIDAITSIFIPSQESFNNMYDRLYTFFDEKLGFLSYPFLFFLDILNLFFSDPIDFIELPLPPLLYYDDETTMKIYFDFIEMNVLIRLFMQIGVTFATIQMLQRKHDSVLNAKGG